MIKCRICGKSYDNKTSHKCPICEYPEIKNPGDGETFVKKNEDIIYEKRKDFLKKVSVSVEMLYHKEIDSKLVVDESRENKLFISNGLDLYEKNECYWNDTMFARIENEAYISVNVVVDVKGTKRKKIQTINVSVGLPNILTPGFQNIGFLISGCCQITVFLLNTYTKEKTQSETIPMFV